MELKYHIKHEHVHLGRLLPFVPRGCFVVFLVHPPRDFHLTHVSRAIHVGSWVAVEPNGIGLPSTDLRVGGLERSSHHPQPPKIRR